MILTAILIILFVITNCQKYPDPGIQILANYFIQPLGNNQRAIIGSILKDSVGVRVIDNKNNQYAKGLHVTFKIITGNGSLMTNSQFTDSNGFAKTKWTLGTNCNNQKMLCEIMTTEGKLINKTEIDALGTGLKPWDTIQYFPENNLQTLVPDFVHHTTFAISGGTLYTYSGQDYTWIKNNSFDDMFNPKTIVTDNQGILYVSTWSGEVFRTNDAGVSWSQCTKPDPSNPYFTDLAITSNHILFAGTNSQKLYRSIDNAATWQRADTLSGYLTWVVACTDSIFYRTGMFRSSDQGVSWNHVGIPGAFFGAYSERDGNILFTNYSTYNSWDLVIYSSSKFLKNLTALKTIESTYSTNKSYFLKIGSTLYYAQDYSGVYMTQNLKDFQLFWKCDRLTGFYVDHNNHFVATDSNHNLYYYNP